MASSLNIVIYLLIVYYNVLTLKPAKTDVASSLNIIIYLLIAFDEEERKPNFDL